MGRGGGAAGLTQGAFRVGGWWCRVWEHRLANNPVPSVAIPCDLSQDEGPPAFPATLPQVPLLRVLLTFVLEPNEMPHRVSPKGIQNMKQT